MTNAATIEKEHDIYGQVHPIETPEMIVEKLQEFDNIVIERTVMMDDENKCLIQAHTECPELLTNTFKLYFLSCQVFNVDLAFGVYQRYWRKRVKVFGPERAFQPLTLDSFTAEERAALDQGYVSLLPGVTDPKGRSIIHIDPTKFDTTKFSRTDLCRAVWYLQHAALENESAQKYGQIYLVDVSRTRYSHFDRKLVKTLLPSLVGSLPSRTAGFHVCHPPTFVSAVLPIVKMFLSERLTHRFLIHPRDNPKSLLKGLNKFGLDDSVIPISMGGDLEVDQVGWLNERQAKGL
jgi:hypothetical protein